jgi:tetratricopeptide (TPR) repeat protein
MFENPFELADVLGLFVKQSGYTPGQLAKLTGIPKPTIVNWLEGRVKRPRVVNDLLKLTAVLHLTESDTNKLLSSAAHPSLAELRGNAQRNEDAALLELLEPWPVAALSPPKLVPFQATADLPFFVGREALLQELVREIVQHKQSQIYSLQGMPGVGKTAVAVHLAYQLRGYFADGVLWAQVSASDTMTILSTFAGAYGVDVSQYGEVESRSRIVRELLASKQTLLVLDDVESSKQVKPLLPPTGACAVLITTRRHHLSAMRGAHRVTLGPFTDAAEALALFEHVVGVGRVARERPYFVELADLLGYLPLAIDIAANRLAFEPGWETADFLQRIRQEKRRLQELAYEDQSVRLSFNMSFEALSTDLQAFFTVLSLFEGEDFSDEAAAFVAGVALEDAQDFLRQLYGLSLIQLGRPTPAQQPTRYRLHLLLRDYARRQFAGDAGRFIAYFVQFVQQHQRHYRQLEWEMENILKALWLAAAEKAADFLQGANTFYFFLEARGLYELAQKLVEKGRATAVALGDSATLAMMVYECGRLAERQGEYIEAEAQYEQALELARELLDRQTHSHLLRALGVLAARRGDYVLADAYYKEGLTLARELGRGGSVSSFLRGLGVQAYMRGDFARAEAFYEEGLALMQQQDEEGANPETSSGMLWGLGVLAEEQGDTTQAEAYYKQALSLVREMGLPERTIILLRNLGTLMVRQAVYTQAERYYGEALTLARQLGHRWQIGRILSEWGELKLVKQEMAEAEAAFSELFEEARVLQSQELVAFALYGLGRVTAVTQGRDEAEGYGQESLDTFIALGHYKVQEVQQWLRHFRNNR